jgi:hypothetical protein
VDEEEENGNQFWFYRHRYSQKRIIFIWRYFFVYTQYSASMILYMRKNENGRRLIGFWFPAFSFQWTWRWKKYIFVHMQIELVFKYFSFCLCSPLNLLYLVLVFFCAVHIMKKLGGVFVHRNFFSKLIIYFIFFLLHFLNVLFHSSRVLIDFQLLKGKCLFLHICTHMYACVRNMQKLFQIKFTSSSISFR